MCNEMIDETAKQTLTHKFTGKIVSVTSDGRQGLVRLDEKTAGKAFAKTLNSTKGREELLAKLPTGRFTNGQRVIGEAEEGSDALRAISIKAVPS